MLSYRYMFMDMGNNYDGNERISPQEVVNPAGPYGFRVSPTEMSMEMHMLGAMYAPTDWLTFVAMANYVSLEMDHVTRMGGEFTTSTEGWGDASIGALFKIWNGEQSSLHGGLNVILPTAGTDEEDFTPAPTPAVRVLPYPMQLGAGSWGLRPSLTYLKHSDIFSFGAQAGGTIFLEENDSGYQLGDSAFATSWIAGKVNDQLSISFRVEGRVWDDIDGSHNDIPAGAVNLIPTADPSLRSGAEINLLFGVNFYETISGFRLGAELGNTIWRDLDGPQLGNELSFTLGALYSW